MPAEPARAPGERRRIDPGVARVVGQKNVGESYEHIARSISTRANRYSTPEQKASPDFPRVRSRAITEGLIQHQRNREVYEHVMGRPAAWALHGSPAHQMIMRNNARQVLTGSPHPQDDMTNDEWMRSMMNEFGPGPEGAH